jgi:hypothetical protein
MQPTRPGQRRGEYRAKDQMDLARAVGASTTDTGNTSNGTTSTPRFSTRLVAGLFADCVCLPLVFSHAR